MLSLLTSNTTSMSRELQSTFATPRTGVPTFGPPLPIHLLLSLTLKALMFLCLRSSWISPFLILLLSWLSILMLPTPRNYVKIASPLALQLLSFHQSVRRWKHGTFRGRQPKCEAPRPVKICIIVRKKVWSWKWKCWYLPRWTVFQRHAVPYVFSVSEIGLDALAICVREDDWRIVSVALDHVDGWLMGLFFLKSCCNCTYFCRSLDHDDTRPSPLTASCSAHYSLQSIFNIEDNDKT